MKLIVGLGNPGDDYLNSRHNLGFDALEQLRHKLGVDQAWQKEPKFKGEIIKFSGLDLILLRPLTFMNKSGQAVSLVAEYFKIKPEDIIVVHDELDLLLGKLKVRMGGAAAGHHGVESIIESLGTDKFVRVRLGIGNQDGFLGEHKRIAFSAESFVMEQFLQNEKSKVKSLLKQAVLAIETIIEKGVEEAQSQHH